MKYTRAAEGQMVSKHQEFFAKVFFHIENHMSKNTFQKWKTTKKAISTWVAMRLIGSVYLAKKGVTLLCLISGCVFFFFDAGQNQ